MTPAFRSPLLAAACVLVAASTLGAAWAAPVADCRRTLLEDLGWRFVEEPGLATPRIHAGVPCDRVDLVAAHAGGDLRVAWPGHFDTDAAAAWYDELLEHPATTCAYAYRLGEATRRAVDKLVANPGYRFTGLQFGWIGFGAGGARQDGWRPIASFGRGFVPRDGNWRAIEGFYSGNVRAECGVGRQVAQYAAQAELYGPAGFDAAFEAGEIVIGRWRMLNAGDSVLQGARAGEYTRDGLARHASALGRQAFVGVPGYIEHVFERHALDDINNQAQNFVVYDVSEAAAAALRTRGGFAAYNAMARELWQLARTFPQSKPHRFFERLLVEGDAALRDELDAEGRATLQRMQALLADPFFGGFSLYVHRQGVRPAGYHFVRMLDRNPRTPFHIAFALHNVHTTLRQRYFEHRLAACAAGTAVADRATVR